MDNTQLPPGMFTPERPRNANGESTIDQVASLSPFFDFASTLSPIAPSRALGGQGMGDAGSAHLTGLAGARSPTPLCFNSPNAHKSASLAGRSGGDRKRSNLSKGDAPAALEEVALSASADVLHSVTAFAQSPLRPGVLDDITDVASVAALRKQLESDFNVDMTEPEAGGRTMSTLEKELLQLDQDLGLDGGLSLRLRSPGHVTLRNSQRPGVRGAAARDGTTVPAGVGAVADMAAAEHSSDVNKRSSTTGASMEFPHGLSKINKKGGEDSPRGATGARSDRGKNRKKTQAAALLEEEIRNGRPSSAPASRGRGGAGDGNKAANARRLSVQASATPVVKGERPPRMSLDGLGGDALCQALEGDPDFDLLGSAPPATCGSKKCNCKKSKCLKLYCECFAVGAYCDNCNCQNCCNTHDNASLVATTRHQIELRNPQAFADKITGDGDGSDARHKKGCHCKKSACLKKYCECFQAGVPCQEYCKCEGCKNTGDGSELGGSTGAAFGDAGVTTATKTKKLMNVTSNAQLATPTRMAQQAAAVAAVERAALFMTDDLMIEDFTHFDGLDGMKSPGRAVLAAAADIGLDLLQSPPKAMSLRSPLRAHGAQGVGGGVAGDADGAVTGSTPSAVNGTPTPIGAQNPGTAMGTPMKRVEMSPITPGSRSKVQGTPGSTILRAGPGRLTLNGTSAASDRSMRSKQAAPPPRFDQALVKETPMKTMKTVGNEVTPKLTRSAKTRSQFGSIAGSHDAATGGMIATLGSPTPLSTPEGLE